MNNYFAHALRMETPTTFLSTLTSYGWNWVTVERTAKEALSQICAKDVDYALLPLSREQTPQRGGHNAESIMMTLRAAKKFAMRARTKRGEVIPHHQHVLQGRS